MFATAALAFSALAAAGPAADVETAGKGMTASDEAFHLVVDLSDRQLHVVENGETTASYDVAVGKPQHPTPRGEFRIRRIVWNPRWVPPDAAWARDKRPRAPGDPRNPMGKVKIFFQQPDYYIHGTRETDSLGQAESHGCVRMRNSEVVSLARRVMANGGAPRSAGWFQRVINRVRSSQDVRLSDPVLVRVRA
ncbi:MAG TPA: L,D-transpeptidase [Longimicrobium sp.]|nr:L,D-transpeptidase [Longimicrobium sp.]